MTTANDARKAHKILDDLFKRKPVLDEEREFLRSALPELPKQKTLEEIIAHVRDAWVGANDNDWAGNSYDRDISIEDWMAELYVQLQGLKDVPANTPALPAGMRLADHEEYGRCVVSPEKDIFGRYFAFHLDNWNLARAACHYVSLDALTFIDSEPAKPAHPEFLETEEDYENAPEGTIVACEDSPPCHKFGSEWSSVLFCGMKDDRGMSRACRRVLRWGWA